MTLSDFQKWLDSYLNFEKTQTKDIFWLDSMKFLAEKLGNPQDRIPCIHVAGSKGKGSVSAMISSVLEQAGFKCGVYTSPHISDFRERISRPDGFFEDSVYEKAADILTGAVSSIRDEELPGGRRPTWFELVTLFSFLCFSGAECDFAVYEVGLGGRLDSTNIIRPLASIITPIELEHTEFLGDTIEKIAGEKAGIIKKGIPCVASRQNYAEAEKVFLDECAKKGSSLNLVGKNEETPLFRFNGGGKMQVEFSAMGRRFSTELKLLGKVQAENAQCAAAALMTAVPGIKKSCIEEGLSRAFLHGRFEVEKNIILDGAHTVKSVENTIQTMRAAFPEKKYFLLFSCSGDKDAEDIVPLFKGVFEKIVFTAPKSVRNADTARLCRAAGKNGIEAEEIAALPEAFEHVKSFIGSSDILLVAGSFYLVSEVRRIMDGT